MEFKETKEEKALHYAENWEEITGLDYENIPPIEVSKIDYIAGYNQALKDSKASEMLEMLQKAKVELSRIKGSMMAHPDCTEGSEFDDYTDSAEEIENEIEQLIKEATEL